MKKSSKIKNAALLSAAFCICNAVAWDGTPVRQDNSVTSLNYAQESSRTLIEIGVQSDPTFSVYSLKNPERVVVEILDCGSNDRVMPVQVRNGVIDTAAISVSQANDYSTCRVILGLEHETTYSVDSNEKTITIAVNGKPEQSTTELAAAYESMKQSREEALAQARAIAAREQAQTVAERDRANAALAQLEASYAEAQRKLAVAESQRDAALNSAQKSESDKTAELARVQSELAKAQSEAKSLEAARNQALARAQQAELQLSASQAQAAQNQANSQAQLEAERDRANAALAKLEASYAEAQQKLAIAESQRDAALNSAQKSESDKTAELARVQSELAKAQSEARTLEAARNQALARAQNAESQLSANQAQAAQNLAKSQAQLEAERDRANAALAKLEASYAEAQQKLAVAESQRDAALNSAQKSESDKTAELARVQSELAKAQSEARTLEAARNQALARAQNAESQLSANQAQAAQNLANSQAQLANSQAQLANSQAQLEAERDRANAALAKLEASYAEAQQKLAIAESQRDAALNSAQKSESDKTAELARVQSELAKAQSEARTLEAARNQALARAQNAESQLSANQAQAAQNLANSQAQLEAERDRANAALAKLEASYAEAQQRLAVAESQRDAALNSAQKSESHSTAELARVQSELAKAQSEARTLEAARNQALARAQQAESELSNSQNLVAQNHAKIAQLEADNANANQRANALAQNYSELASENADLLRKLAQQNAEMERLNKEVLAGGAAREKLKKLDAQNAENAAQIAELKAQARQGRHALAELDKLKAENAQLQAKADKLQAQTTVMAATTAGNAQQPAVAAIVSTVPPIDQSVATTTVAQNPTVAPLDRQAAAMASIKDIQFRNNPDNNGMQVVVKLSAPVDKVESQDIGSQKSMLRIANAVLPDNFNKKYDTSAFNQGVRFVDSMQGDGGIELIAQSSSRTVDAIEQNGDTIIWNIKPLRDLDFTAPVDRRQQAMVTAAEPSGSSSTMAYGADALKNTPLAKRKITIDIHDADINDLLRLLSDEINTSIVVSPDVKGNVTLSLKSVPLDQAMNIILRMHDLGMRYEGNVIWIAKAQQFREEEERALKAAEVREKLEPLEVRLIPVNYATASQLSSNIQAMLSSRGTINIDERTNTLILKDVAANLDAAEILVNNLDTQTPQILIEARIVETQANFTKEIGIQWGGDGVASAATGNATGIVFPSSIGIAGGSTSENNAGTSATPNFAVNLPAAVGTGQGGAIGMSLGSIGGAINLNIRLSALESKGFLKIVSSPRIMTLDNIQASIQQGTSIPISVVSAAGAQTVFYDANLNLQVTPHVTRDGNVYLKIDISKNEPDFGNTGANGDPSIIRKQAHTELLIPDGDTTVIGGIYTRNTGQSMSSVPFFGSIPILGYLFRSTSETDNRTELLIFITPRIINRDASIAASGHGSFIPPVEREDNSKK